MRLFRRFLLPFLFAAVFADSPAAARIEKDIPFVVGGGHKQQLDLYLPGGKNFTTILLVHGGSLEVGDRQEAPFPAIAEAFQREGFACAVISYRLKGDAAWPAPAHDTAAAFAWIKKNIAVRGGDAGRIYALGHSSGARLVAMIGADPALLKVHDLAPRDITGVIPMGTILNHKDALEAMEKATPEQLARAFASVDYKPFGNVEGYRKSWPQAHIGAHLPPFLILIAEEEKFQPPILARAEEFAEAARAQGVTVFIEVLAGRTHMSALEKLRERGDATFARILRFIRQGQ